MTFTTRTVRVWRLPHHVPCGAQFRPPRSSTPPRLARTLQAGPTQASRTSPRSGATSPSPRSRPPCPTTRPRWSAASSRRARRPTSCRCGQWVRLGAVQAGATPPLQRGPRVSATAASPGPPPRAAHTLAGPLPCAPAPPLAAPPPPPLTYCRVMQLPEYTMTPTSTAPHRSATR